MPGAYGNITFDLYLGSTVTSTRSVGVSWKIGTVAASNWSLNYTAGSATSDTFGYITTPAAADLNVLTPAQSYITAVIA